MRRNYILAFLFLVILFSFTNAAEKEKRPNILILISDDQSADDIGAVTGGFSRTPALDSLVSQGLRFVNAYASSPQCSPSRSSILTGRSSHATATSRLHSKLADEYPTIVEALRNAGYYVGAFRKVHLGDVFQRRWSYYGGDDVPFEDFFRQRPKDHPFFLWIGFHDPHRPYPKNVRPSDAIDKIKVQEFLPDTAAVRMDLVNYYDALERMDADVEKVLSLLKKEQLDQNTIVFFIGDNGMPFPGAKGTLHDEGVRVPLLVRWPGKIAAGETRKDVVSLMDLAPTWLELANAKSLPRMEGRSLVAEFTGKTSDSDRAVFFERNWHDNLDLIRAVRSGRYVLIQNYLPELAYVPTLDLADSPSWSSIQELHNKKQLPPALESRYFKSPRPEVELYDMETDPFQLHNLASDPAQKGKVQELQTLLRKWMIDTNDFLPPPLPAPFGPQGEPAHP